MLHGLKVGFNAPEVHPKASQLPNNLKGLSMNKSICRVLPLALLTALVQIAAAKADVVYLKNGDHITGKIVSAESDKVVITPDFSKSTNLCVAISDIATFTTAEPIILKLKDGTVINQAVQKGKDGEVKTAPGGTLVTQPVALAKIDKINPNTSWTGAVGVNGMYQHSNATTTTLGMSADGVRRTDNDRITANGAYNFGTQKVNGVTTVSSSNWNAEGAYDYFISKTWYSYADMKFGADHVNHLSLRFTPSLGAGYQWVDQADLHFNTEGGLAYIYQDYSTSPKATKDIALRLAYHADKSFDSDRIKLFHDLAFLPSVQNSNVFLVQTDAGVRIALLKSMYSEAKVNINYDNNPPSGTRNTTTQFLMGLGLTY